MGLMVGYMYLFVSGIPLDNLVVNDHVHDDKEPESSDDESDSSVSAVQQLSDSDSDEDIVMHERHVQRQRHQSANLNWARMTVRHPEFIHIQDAQHTASAVSALWYESRAILIELNTRREFITTPQAALLNISIASNVNEHMNFYYLLSHAVSGAQILGALRRNPVTGAVESVDSWVRHFRPPISLDLARRQVAFARIWMPWPRVVYLQVLVEGGWTVIRQRLRPLSIALEEFERLDHDGAYAELWRV
jgi:hypothetical protein